MHRVGSTTAFAPGTFVAVVGPSGSGKDSILQAAARILSSNHNVLFVRRVITRPTDSTEDHQAVDEDTFAQMAVSGDLAFTWEAHGLRYGLPAGVISDLAAGRTVIANVSRTVVASLREQYRRVLVISIEAPEHILAARLQMRGRESERARTGRLTRKVACITADVRVENAGRLSDAVQGFIDAVTTVSSRVAPSSAARYAIYLAPQPTSALWTVASKFIGYDAASGKTLNGSPPAGMTHGEWSALTKTPATYGFHATLKAPFRLVPDKDVAHLIERLAAFCARSKSIALGPCAVRAVHVQGGAGFVALVPTSPPAELAELELAVVTHFDDCRAQFTAAEYQRRRPEHLTPRQLELLQTYGYPFVLDEFRCHFTLTAPTEQAREVANTLDRHFAAACGLVTFVADALVLFEQPAPGAPFRILRRFPFGAVA